MDDETLSSPNKRTKLEKLVSPACVATLASDFDRLPDEMVELILDFVQTPAPDGSKDPAHSGVRLVCQRWNQICKPRLQYKGVLQWDTVESFVQLNPEIKLKSLILSDLQDNRVRKRSRRLQSKDCLPWTSSNDAGAKDFDPRLFERSVEHLVVGGEAGIFLRRHGHGELPYSLSTGFAEDHRILKDVMRSIKGSELVVILQQLRDVKTLTLSSVAFMTVSFVEVRKISSLLQFSMLSTLDICVGSKTDPHKLGLFLANASFPVLKSLYIRIYALCFHFSLYVSIYRFISKHPLLKNLSLSQAQAIYGLPRDPCNYPELQVAANPNILENLMKIKLECLRMDCLVMGHEIGQQWKELEFAFLKNQTNLRGLELQLNLRTFDCRLDQMLPACGNTLERLELSSTNVAPNSFDCSVLASFVKLKDCHLYLRNCLNVGLQDRATRVGILETQKLPVSVKSLHLSRIPALKELEQLKGRLVNLKRISYSCAETETSDSMTPVLFVKLLLEHLKFPRLVEYRMYTYSCTTVVDFLHCQNGLVAYIEDEDSVVILVDREELDLSTLSERVSSVPNCSCDTCIRHIANWY